MRLALVPPLILAAVSAAAVLVVWDRFEPIGPDAVLIAGLVAVLALVTFLFRDRARRHSESVTAESLRSASVEAALDCIVTVDSFGIVIEWNEAARKTFGYRREDAIGSSISELIIPPEYHAEHQTGLERMRAGGETPIVGRRIEVNASHARGGTFPIEMAITRVSGDPPMFTAFMRDLSERRRREEENQRLAAIVRSSEDAIISKDLNGIVTAWNGGAEELYGYSAAEAIGKSVASLIVPPDRAGEAEEVTEGAVHGDPAALVTQRLTKNGELREVSVRAFPIRNLEGEIIGVSASAHDITDRRHREAVEREDTDRRLWRRRIKGALTHDNLVFWAQPVLDLDTGKLHHRELLIRMELEGRIVPPGEFLHHAESSELISEIDHWAVARGVELALELPVAINLSARSLSNPRLIDSISRTIEVAGASPSDIVFEITETAAAENLDAARVLVEQLRSLGCEVALDDFGTGYGSFTYLKHLPVTELKIDMSFIRGLADNDLDQRVVQSIVMVAKNFDIDTVAEGVEDEATLDLLRGMDVDLVQGYHLGRPQPTVRAEALVGK